MTLATATLRFLDLGFVEYDLAMLRQRELVEDRIADRAPDTVIFVEHPPTITLGRAADRQHVLLAPDQLAERGVALRETDRGGDVTYHGPGQLVGYPIVDLGGRGRDIHRYLRDLEQVLIDALAELELDAERVPGRTGVWVGERKIAAIGVKVTRWVTSHGFALNVGPDLSGFQLIVPCGIRDRGVTSVSHERGRTVALDEVKPVVRRHLLRHFGGAG
jgi:lipoyl(octanoyl) transferase